MRSGIFLGNPARAALRQWTNDMPGLTYCAAVLASSPGCARQIVRNGNNAYGFQCHLEITVDDIQMLIEMNNEMYRAVAEGGQIVWHDSDAPPGPWWSLSKTAIAAAALVLVQRGDLELDGPLLGHKFTLRQLLQHAAGVPDYGDLAEYHQAVHSGLTPWSRAELFDRIEARRSRSAPGTRFLYSNVGYTIVRGLIEDATGSHLGDALDELVFRQLGLEDVRVASVAADLGVRAWGSPRGYHPGWVFHGLVVSTPSQAALFLNRLLDGELLHAALLESMREPMMISNSGFADRPWNTAGYGLGLMIDLRSPLGPCYGHTGQGPGSTTATYRFEALDGARTVSVFAEVKDQGSVESEVLALATRAHIYRAPT